jgi:hypothetical protein
VRFRASDVLDLLESSGVDVVRFGSRVRLEKGPIIRVFELEETLTSRFVAGLARLFGVPEERLFALPRVTTKDGP